MVWNVAWEVDEAGRHDARSSFTTWSLPLLEAIPRAVFPLPFRSSRPFNHETCSRMVDEGGADAMVGGVGGREGI